MHLAISYQITVVAVLLSVCTVRSKVVCDFDKFCSYIYDNLEDLFEEPQTDMNSLCSLSQELKVCMTKQTGKCQGVLNFHVFEELVRNLMTNIGERKNCTSSSRSSWNGIARPGSQNDESSRGPSSRYFGNASYKCAPKVKAGAPSVGCALFGLTNIKSFSEILNNTDINYCSLAGAWSLIDTPEFAVEITNKEGLSPLLKDITTTTLVTVIIKRNQCSDRKTYQATFDEVPGMFTDGFTTARNVYIETMKESEHVKIHFPYLRTIIDVNMVIGFDGGLPIPSLTVTIKMPQVQANALMKEPNELRGLPLCFYGCPKTATLGLRSVDSSSSSSSSSYRSNCPTLGQDESSLEFLNSGGGSWMHGDSSSNSMTSAICASLKSVQSLLSESTIVRQKLVFPGEENFGSPSDSSNSALSDFPLSHAENSLTSWSAGLSGFHSLILYFSMVLVLLL